jgi:acetylornithine deacetylase
VPGDATHVSSTHSAHEPVASEALWPVLHGAAERHRSRMVQLLSESISFASVSGEEGECARWFTERLSGLGLDLDVWEPDAVELACHPAFVERWPDYAGRPNIVATRRGLGGGRRLILNGHTDVVPVDDLDQWTHDPWQPTVEGDRIYGRGAVDMKGGCIVALACLEILRELELGLAGDVAVHFVVDEEATGNGTLAAVLRGHYGPDSACIFLEPTGSGALVAASRGAQYFRITVPGYEIATEYQATFPNAITEAARLVLAIDDFRATRELTARHPLYGKEYQRVYAETRVPHAVCRVSAGAWPSTLPASCILEGTIECLPGEDIDEIFGVFREYVLDVSSRSPWLKEHPPTVEPFGLRYEAGATDADDPFVELVAGVATDVTGARPPVVGGAGNDLRHAVLYGQSPSVVFGPTGSSFHAVDEWVSIDELVTFLEISLRVAVAWCGEASSVEGKGGS